MEKTEELEGGGATSDEEQNVSKHVTKTVKLKARKVSVIQKAKITQNIQSKIMYTSNQMSEGKEWEQNIFDDSGSDLDLVGAEKVAKDGVETIKNMEKMDVENVQLILSKLLV